MVRTVSKKVIERLRSNNVIEDEDYEIYQYGLEQLLTSILDIMTLFLIGLILGMLWQGIVFVISFIALRKYAGGYHTTTPLRCYLLTNIVILSALSVMKYIKINIFIYLGLFVISSLIILALSPVESKNKELDEIERIIYRKKTICIWFIEAFLTMLSFMLMHYEISICIIMAVIILGVSLLLGKME